MVLRTVVGAVAGAVAGAGFVLTMDIVPSRSGIGLFAMAVSVFFAFWMLVAGVLIVGGFRLGRQERGWWTTGIGSGLWVVMIVSLMFSGVFGKHAYMHLFETAVVLVPCVAYAVAALGTSTAVGGSMLARVGAGVAAGVLGVPITYGLVELAPSDLWPLLLGVALCMAGTAVLHGCLLKLMGQPRPWSVVAPGLLLMAVTMAVGGADWGLMGAFAVPFAACVLAGVVTDPFRGWRVFRVE